MSSATQHLMITRKHQLTMPPATQNEGKGSIIKPGIRSIMPLATHNEREVIKPGSSTRQVVHLPLSMHEQNSQGDLSTSVGVH
eukprot:1159649-Pelagomonas_calceolata.AAC.4